MENKEILLSKNKEKLRKNANQSKKSTIFKSKRKQILTQMFTQDQNSSIINFNPKNNNQIQEIYTNDELNLLKMLNEDQSYINSKYISNVILLICKYNNANSKTKNYAYSFCTKFNLIIPPICTKCSQQMKRAFIIDYQESRGWRCFINGCNKRKVFLYTDNPLFQTFQLPLSFLLKLFIQLLPCQTNALSIKQQQEISFDQITKARQIWKQALLNFYQKFYQNILLGDDSSVIEVDEAHFKRKYNRGRYIKNSTWILGITERNNGFQRTLFFPIQTRDQITLSTIISQFVSKKCVMICSDKWKGYNNLKKLGYNHETVNHSKNFVTPKNNENNNNNNQQKGQRNYKLFQGHYIHTQSIENKWNQSPKITSKISKRKKKKFYI